MTARAQRRLAYGAAIAGLLLFLGANAHFLAAAMNSQPDCREVAGLAPAKPAC